MNHWLRAMLVIYGVSRLLTSAEARQNPFAHISGRNVFALRTVVPVEQPIPTNPKPPASDIRLTGLSTLLGEPIVILEITDPQTKKTDHPSPFRIGDRYQDEFIVLGIDVGQRTVCISREGVEMVLDFQRNGIKEGTFAAAQPSPPVTPRTTPSNSTTPTASPRPMLPEQAKRLIEDWRRYYEEQKDPVGRLLPPTQPEPGVRSLVRPVR
jgi:hypothetical protein